ncbi:Hypothetical predicted protein [Mytilus galloprovincialis]|uniref:Sodium/potassium-transporting ATPase subunit beta-1-interacting protein n=1 Tax=Mytilus galloprovincialis TaxID=29158 RepID=A0A8B6BF12_MYTGA|nr:Hypothetical predicted protein [Mytilus galloprovincialis]
MKYKQLSIVAMAFQGKCANTAMYTAMMVVILLQFLSTLERQVFDFLGYMWAPIIANFFQLICVIIGGFGTYQFRSKFITLYSTWSLIWLGWNVFVICLYLEVGVLSRNKDLYILNIGTKNKSWWLEHGIGCRITNTSWLDSSPTDSSRPIPPEDVVEGCLLDYYYVEVIHAGVQVLLALIGFVISCVNAYIFVEEEESCKYLSRSTYYRPTMTYTPVPNIDSPDIPVQVIDNLDTRKLVNHPDTWCLPTYVSYAESQEWSTVTRTRSLQGFTNTQDVILSLV